MRHRVISVVVCLLAAGGWATGQLPPVAQRHEVKQIISLDQEQKIAFLLGVDQGGRVEFFSVPIYEISSSGQPYTDRLVRKDQGEILEIGGTGSGDSTRLVALLNTGKVFVFTVTPPSKTPTPLEELSKPERILQSTSGFNKIRATPSHLIIQEGARNLVIFDTKEFIERQRTQSVAPIIDFMVEGDRVIVQAQQDIAVLDLQGKTLAQLKRSSPPIGIGAFESGFFIYDEKSLLILDRNGARTGEVKVDQPIKAVAAARETVAIISGTQTLLFNRKGERISSIIGGPFERLTSSSNRFFLSKGQEIWILDATTGQRLKVITLRNQLENFVGLRRGLAIVVRQRDTNRLIYAVYDEQGDQLSLGFLLEFRGPRP